MYPDPEVAASFSGGGFSDYFERPYYQETAVSDFLDELGDHYAGLYKCARCAVTLPFLTLYLVQPFGSWLPRHRRASDRILNRLK
jgi:hypothetical protein